MSQPFHGQTAAFLRKIIQCLPDNLTSRQMQHWIENPSDLKRSLALVLATQEHSVWKTLRIKPRTSEALKEALVENNISAHDNVKAMISQFDLGSSSSEINIEITLWSIEDLGLRHQSNVSLRDVKRRAEVFGFKIAPLEIALEMSLSLTPKRDTLFIPYFKNKNCGGMIVVDPSNEPLYFMMEDNLPEDEAITCSPTVPMVLMRTLETLDNQYAHTLFTEELCDHFDATVKLRSRVLNLIHQLGDDQRNVGKLTVREFCDFSETELIRLPHVGSACVNLIQQVLGHFDLRLRIKE